MLAQDLGTLKTCGQAVVMCKCKHSRAGCSTPHLQGIKDDNTDLLLSTLGLKSRPKLSSAGIAGEGVVAAGWATMTFSPWPLRLHVVTALRMFPYR